MYHETVKLWGLDPNLGTLELEYVWSAPSNTSVGWVQCDLGAKKDRLVFNGEILAEYPLYDRFSWAISNDGKQVAYTVKERSDERFTIFVNGERRYEVNLDLISCIRWFPDGRLAWWGLYDPRKRPGSKKGLLYFVDGEDVTGRLRLESVFGGRNSSILCVIDYNRGISSAFYDDGRVEEWAGTDEFFKDRPGFEEKRQRDLRRKDKAQLVLDQKESYWRVWFNCVAGPEIDSFEDVGSGVGDEFVVFNKDETRIAYCGVVEHPCVRAAGGGLIWPLKIADRCKSDFWAKFFIFLGVPGGLLFNESFGPLRHLSQRLRRHVVFNNHVPWKKKYKFAHNFFFTAKDQLVVVAYDNGDGVVVIDEEEGPKFEKIYNVRYAEGVGQISYIGFRDNTFYRVTVQV